MRVFDSLANRLMARRNAAIGGADEPDRMEPCRVWRGRYDGSGRESMEALIAMAFGLVLAVPVVILVRRRRAARAPAPMPEVAASRQHRRAMQRRNA